MSTYTLQETWHSQKLKVLCNIGKEHRLSIAVQENPLHMSVLSLGVFSDSLATISPRDNATCEVDSHRIWIAVRLFLNAIHNR